MSSLQTRGRSSGFGVLSAALAMGLLLLGLWALEGLDQASGNALDGYGIRPRTDEGLLAIFVAPWLHGGWAHLVSNSLPFFLLGVLVLLEGWRGWLSATLVIVVASGATVWLLAPAGSITLGASGVVFGWLTYLMARGFYTRSPGQIAVGFVVFLLYGGMLWGVLPGNVNVSWQAHLGGAVGGLIAARMRRASAAYRPGSSYAG